MSDIEIEIEPQDDLFEFNEYIAMALQVKKILIENYQQMSYQQIYDIFLNSYNSDQNFAGICWAFCGLSKDTNSFSELLDKALLKSTKTQIPIQKVTEKVVTKSKSRQVQLIKDKLMMEMLIVQDDDDEIEMEQLPKINTILGPQTYVIAKLFN